jgi:hypothetical protein
MYLCGVIIQSQVSLNLLLRFEIFGSGSSSSSGTFLTSLMVFFYFFAMLFRLQMAA